MAICANVPSRLLPQWYNGYLYTSAHDVQLHTAGYTQLPMPLKRVIILMYQTVNHALKCISFYKTIRVMW